MTPLESMDLEEVIRLRQALLDHLNAIEDEYAARGNADAVFAIMQAKQDLGFPIHREGRK